jgi:hypothetical protein
MSVADVRRNNIRPGDLANEAIDNPYEVSRKTTERESLTISGPQRNYEYEVIYRFRGISGIRGTSEGYGQGNGPSKAAREMVEGNAKEDLFVQARAVLARLKVLLPELGEAERREPWE